MAFYSVLQLEPSAAVDTQVFRLDPLLELCLQVGVASDQTRVSYPDALELFGSFSVASSISLISFSAMDRLGHALSLISSKRSSTIDRLGAEAEVDPVERTGNAISRKVWYLRNARLGCGDIVPVY